MQEWDIYSITSTEKLHGVKFRGKLRLFGLKNNLNLLAENATDLENCVRFAVLHDENVDSIKQFILSIVEDASISLTLTKIPNPVLSKLIVNKFERYDG